MGVDGVTLVTEHGAVRDNFQVRQLGSAVNEAFSDAVTKVFGIFIVAHVLEGHDGQLINYTAASVQKIKSRNCKRDNNDHSPHD